LASNNNEDTAPSSGECGENREMSSSGNDSNFWKVAADFRQTHLAKELSNFGEMLIIFTLVWIRIHKWMTV